MHDSKNQADRRAPPPEGFAVAGKVATKREERYGTQQVDRSDGAQGHANQRKSSDDSCARERVERPERQDRSDEQRNHSRIPMAVRGHPRHSFAGAEEAVPRGTEDDATNMKQRSHRARGSPHHQEGVWRVGHW